MKKLLIFLMIAIPLVVIFIVNVTVDAVAGIVIIPVEAISIEYTGTDPDITPEYEVESNKLSLITVNNISKTIKLKSNVYPESSSNKGIYWKSADENVAVVDNHGTVTFVGFGSVDIYAVSSDGTIRTSCLFIVTDIRVHGITIYAGSTVLELNSDDNYKTDVWARVIPSTAINQTYTLTSTNPNVVSINAAGVATALSVGEATIIATSTDSSTGSCPFDMITIKVVKSVKDVSLIPPIPLQQEALIIATNTIRLDVDIFPEDATNRKVSFTTTDPNIAQVNNDGAVTFLQEGEVIITVVTEDGGHRSSIKLKYTGGYPDALNIEEKNKKIEVDVSNGIVERSILFSFSPNNPPITNLLFTSNDEEIATVNQNGLIRILKGGNATITIHVLIGENLYYPYYITVSSKRNIDSINFPTDNIVTAVNNVAINPTYSPSDATEISYLVFSIIYGDELATISPSGEIIFNSAGQIVVEVRDTNPAQTKNVFKTITVTYTGGYPQDFSLDTDLISIQANQSIYLTLGAFFPIEASIREFYFEIESQSSIYGYDVISLTLESNNTYKVIGLSGGSAIVRAYVKVGEGENDWIFKSFTIIVSQEITKIELGCEEEIYEDKYISANYIFNFTTSIFPTDATNANLIYELSDPTIATIIDNDKVCFNRAGIVVLTVRSEHNPNIRASITLWYTGGCAIGAKVAVNDDGEDISIDTLKVIKGNAPFIVYLTDIIPANAINKSFKVTLTNNQTINGNKLSVSYNSDRTQAILTILNSGNVTLSFSLIGADGKDIVFLTEDLNILQKVNYIRFPYPSQTTSATQINLQCEISPINASQTEIIYLLVGEGDQDKATINGNILTFNPSINQSETVTIIAILTDVDGSTKTAEIEITTTFGIISAPEGNSISLYLGNSVIYNYADELSGTNRLEVIVNSGEAFIQYELSDLGLLTITALSAGESILQVNLLSADGELIRIVAELTITVEEKIENIILLSDDLTKIGSKYVTAQNNIQLNFNVLPTSASNQGLIYSISDPSIAVYNQESGILTFASAGMVEITVTSPDNECVRSFIIQYTNGASISATLNIESETNFYFGQTYLVAIISFLPINSNITITNITEIIASGGVSGIQTEISGTGINVTFLRSGSIKLRITLSDSSQKIIIVNVVSSLSEIIFENDNILTALKAITLNPNLLPASATNKTLIYESSDITVATVTSTGQVTFLKAGTVIITARSAESPSVMATCQITSTFGEISDFTLNYTDLTLRAGEIRSLIVNSYTPVNADQLNFVYQIISSVTNDGSGNPVISINGNNITCLRGGTAVIKVYITKQNGEVIYKTCTGTVLRELDNFYVTLGQQLDTYEYYLITSLTEIDFSITLNPIDATILTHDITIDRPNIAKIEDGKIIFLSEGLVKITFTYNNKIRTLSILHTLSAVRFEIDDSNSIVENGIRKIYLNVGQTYEVKIKNIIPSDLNQDVISLSLILNSPNYGNEPCCTISNYNIITGTYGGSSKFAVTVNGYTSSEQLLVTVVRLATSIECPQEIVTASSTYPLSAFVLPRDTTDQRLTYTVISSSPNNCATVNTNGVVSFTAEGEVRIKIENTASGKSTIVKLTYNMAAKQIIFQNSIKYVFIGSSIQLITRIEPFEAENEEIIWSVSDPSLATINSNGHLTPTIVDGRGKEGIVTVTAKLKNFPEVMATIDIEIFAKITTLTFKLKNADDNRGIAGKRVFGTLNLYGTDNASILRSNEMTMEMQAFVHNCVVSPKLIWKSSDESIASVDTDGKITVYKAGQVTITCEPTKQYYSNPAQYVKASYTFTFVEGLNITRAEKTEETGGCALTIWTGSSIFVFNASEKKILEELDENGNHPTEPAEKVEILKFKYRISKAPGVLLNDLSVRTITSVIEKNLYGNGYTINLNFETENPGSTLYFKGEITVNNVIFKGYNFLSPSDPLSKLIGEPSIVDVSASVDEINKVTFKNCIFNGGNKGIYVKNSDVTLSGCIVINTYEGGITVSSNGVDYPNTNILVKNSVFEKCLVGAVLISCENIHNKNNIPPKVTFEGDVRIFNWQPVGAYNGLTLSGPLGSGNDYLSDQIPYIKNKYKDTLKTDVHGNEYIHFGIVSAIKLNVTIEIIPLKFTLELQFNQNNSNVTYGLTTYTNSATIGSYIIENYNLGKDSTIGIDHSYSNDIQGTYNRIRDNT